MTRDELEAAIWQAMRRHLVTTPDPVKFVDALLAHAGDYATTEGGITAERRRALLDALDPPPAVHYGRDRQACRARHLANAAALPLTDDPAQVTCPRCKHTRAYLEAS